MNCLADSESIVVARAVEVLADAGQRAALTGMVKLLKHESAVVQAASCMAIGLLGADEALPAIVDVLRLNNNQDPILRHAGIMGLAGVKDYQKIVLRREAFKGMVRALFEKVDVLAVPAQTFTAR